MFLNPANIPAPRPTVPNDPSLLLIVSNAVATFWNIAKTPLASYVEDTQK